MPGDARESELRAAVVRKRAGAASAGVPHIRARLLLAVVLFAVCAALLALAISGDRRAAPEESGHAPAGASGRAQAGVWTPLARVQGRAINGAAPFHVADARWRLRWTVTPRPGVRERYFRIRVNQPDAPDYSVTVSLEGQGTQHGACILPGPGDRSLTVFSHHSYEVVAEEWRATAAHALAIH